jgi:flagellar basal-body rod protein FlgC
MDVSASGLTAQRLRLDIISQNIANAQTTRTEGGGPYQRQAVIFETISNTKNFGTLLSNHKEKVNNGGVRVSQIIKDQKESPLIYDPTHPDANEQGYVSMPNVNTVEEMVNMISASRSYEANVTAFNSMKSMVTKALEIGKG